MLCRKGIFRVTAYPLWGRKAVTPPSSMFSPNIHIAAYSAVSTSAAERLSLWLFRELELSAGETIPLPQKRGHT